MTPTTPTTTTVAPVPDRVVVHPLGDRGLTGTVRMPGDKSLSHRAFILGALADGPVQVTGAAPSGDVRSTVAALRLMGARIDGGPADAVVEGPLREPSDVLDCGNSGTGMRLLAGLCGGVDGLSILTGDGSLRSRPMGRVAVPLRRMGVAVDGRGGGDLAPIAVRGGPTLPLDHELSVASAQVKSAILLAGLAAAGTTRITEPGPSRDHTERMLRWMGVHVTSAPGEVAMTPSPLGARPIQVAGDPSSAAFWLVAGAVLPGSAVRVTDVCLNPTRTGVVDALLAMGAAVTGAADREWGGEPVGDLEVVAGELSAGEVAGELVVRAIDELPVLAVAGALGGGLWVREAEELRVKEVDRIDAVAALLGALGVLVETAPDGFRVPGGQSLTGGTIDSRGDHRIAMAAAIAALAAAQPVLVTGFGAVATSYPSFLADLAALGGRWEAA